MEPIFSALIDQGKIVVKAHSGFYTVQEGEGGPVYPGRIRIMTDLANHSLPFYRTIEVRSKPSIILNFPSIHSEFFDSLINNQIAGTTVIPVSSIIPPDIVENNPDIFLIA